MPSTARSSLTAISQRAQHALAAPDGHVPSPCIQQCRINPDDQYCNGCLRSIHEITAWRNLDDASKRQVWRETVVRAAAAV